jgi:hypothetical protein
MLCAHAVACLPYFVPRKLSVSHIDAFISCPFEPVTTPLSVATSARLSSSLTQPVRETHSRNGKRGRVRGRVRAVLHKKQGRVRHSRSLRVLAYDLIPYFHPLLARVAPVLLDYSIWRRRSSLARGRTTQTYLIRTRTSNHAILLWCQIPRSRT